MRSRLSLAWILCLGSGLTIGNYAGPILYASRATQTPAAAPALPLWQQAPDPLGGGKDDGPPLTAFLNGLQPGSCAMVSPGAQYTLLSPVTLLNASVAIVCPGTADARSPNLYTASFTTAFPVAGVDAALTLNNCRLCRLEGLTFNCQGPNPPACAVRIDSFPDPGGKPLVGNSTRNSLLRCVFTPPAAKGTWAGVDIARGTNVNGVQYGNTNQDFMTVDGLFSPVKSTVGWGCAVKVGRFTNSKWHTIRGSITGATQGVWLQNGSADIDISGANNLCDVQIDDCADPVRIRANTEQAVQPLKLQTQNAPIVVWGSRFANIQGPVAIDAKVRQLVLIGNEIGGQVATKAFASYPNSNYTLSETDTVWQKINPTYESWTLTSAPWFRPF